MWKATRKKELVASREVSWEKAMAPQSSPLAWKIPQAEEPGGLQSMGSQRVGHDWATSLWLFTFMHWRRQWQPTPVFLPGESQGRGSLAGCHLWGRTESDTTEATWRQQQQRAILRLWCCVVTSGTCTLRSNSVGSQVCPWCEASWFPGCEHLRFLAC